ncbi:hypothetical protein [Algoriphagus terrigena]|uniref:hypothetical protein n=1 Tax=Algoriphagus terrigena TaxID=344884 RepID=UPI00047BBECA|nr:hypothetical protein [Algoriphagus terrigena]
MDTFFFLIAAWDFFPRRIYWIFLAVGVVCLTQIPAFTQEIGAYKTIASGTFTNISIWAEWDGILWNPAITKPDQSNDIYIDQTHTLTLTGNESVKSVFINAETGAGQKLNLNGFNLDIYGTLNAFSGAAPGIPDNAWNSINWIGNSIESTLTFKGTSRVLVQKSSWSAQTTQSRFSVIFEADPGETFTLDAPFKSLSFTIRSGILHQKIDTSVIPNACFTLSFNTETTVFGVDPFGELVVEAGATFLSECNSNILNRSTSGASSAQNFDLQNGGTLILEGNAPRIETANFQLNGRVIFRAGSAPKSYLASSYDDATNPTAVRDLEIQGAQNLILPSQLTLLGSLQKSGPGNFVATNTTLTLTGSADQEILGFPLVVRDLVLNKSSGDFYPNSNLTVQRNLTLTQGSMNLEGNELSVNTGLAGSFSYTYGSWKNVGQLHYFGIPTVLTATNSTFPFEDTQNRGLRKVQLLGSSPGGNLSMSFTEYEGAEYQSGFDDTDGTEILYRLFSYFSFSNLTPSADPIELRISAADLIVDDVDDLRIVGTGYAAPGSHLAGLDPIELWARRDLTFGDLSTANFTIGSFRTLSILPVTWLEINSKFTTDGVVISWTVVQAEDNLYYEVYRSPNPGTQEWEKVGTVASIGQPDQVQTHQFLDTSPLKFQQNYYQVKLVAASGQVSWSAVTGVLKTDTPAREDLSIYPNPYSSGPLHLNLPTGFNSTGAELVIQNAQGKTSHHAQYLESDLAPLVQNLAPGLYHFSIVSTHRLLTGKLIRK